MRDAKRTGKIKQASVMLIAILTIGMSFVIPAAGDDISDEDTRVQVDEGDFVVSYDDEGYASEVSARHPAVAVTPTNAYTIEKGINGTIHVVWDEADLPDPPGSSNKEIHYSKSEDKGNEWSNDEKSEDDRVISERRKGRAVEDAENPSICVDSQGVVHVVWKEWYVDDTWEVHYSRSDDNGKTWTGADGAGDMVISRRYGDRQDAIEMSAPKIAVGIVPGKAPEVLHVVWAELKDKSFEQDVYYSKSEDGGNFWTGIEVDQIISKPGGQERSYDPCVATSGEFSEFVQVAWKQSLPGKAPTDEIFWTRGEDYGNSWQGEENIISDEGLPAIIGSVSMSSGFTEAFVAWDQIEAGKASLTGVFYSATPDDGFSWPVREMVVSNQEDGNKARDVSVGATNPAAKASSEVHILWSEFDDKSPAGTWEVHNSVSLEPMDPGSWSGLEGDNVLSWPDDYPDANVNNVSVVMGFVGEEWRPQIVWDENNYTGGKGGGRADSSTEIHHIPPPPLEYILSTFVAGSGTITKNPDLPAYPPDTIVTLTANPSAGWSFDHWSGDMSGSTNPDTITMDADKSVTAHFVHKDLVANSVSGPASCTEGDTIGIPRSFSNTGSQDSGTFRYGLYLSTNSVISTGDTLIYSFQIANQAAGTTNTGTINVGLPMGLTGTYYYGLIVDYTYMVTESNEGNNAVASASTVTIDPKVFSLILISSPGAGGSINASPGAPYYYMDVVTLTANPNAGWSFDHWEVDLTGSTNPDTVTMDSDKTVTAVFTQDQYTLTVTTVGSGSVTKNPDLPTYTYNTFVELTANPNAGWSFDQWTGDLTGSTNPDTIIMNGNKAVTATFTEDQYTLSTPVVGSGTVNKNPNQPTYTYGTPVQLTAVPNAGWSFDHWSGDLTGSTNPDTITIYGDSSVTAHFTQDQYTLSIFPVGSGTVNKNPNQAWYYYGDPVTLTANPSVGWEFDHWSGDLTGSTNPDVITIYGDSTVWAHFNEIYYDIPLVAGWNLVSVPLIQTDTTITTVLSSITGQYDMVQYFDANDPSDHWKTYATFKPPSLNDLWNINRTMGFWLHTTSACILTVYGPVPAATGIPLYAGTNMVGYPSLDTATTVATALSGTGYDRIEVCDLAEPYNLREVTGAYVMQPGEGYIIHVPADTTWTVNW